MNPLIEVENKTAIINETSISTFAHPLTINNNSTKKTCSNDVLFPFGISVSIIAIGLLILLSILKRHEIRRFLSRIRKHFTETSNYEPELIGMLDRRETGIIVPAGQAGPSNSTTSQFPNTSAAAEREMNPIRRKKKVVHFIAYYKPPRPSSASRPPALVNCTGPPYKQQEAVAGPSSASRPPAFVNCTGPNKQQEPVAGPSSASRPPLFFPEQLIPLTIEED